MKVHIFGTGGCGLEFIKSQFAFANHGSIPHQRGATLPLEDKFIYLYANPADILNSFARRFLLENCVANLQGDPNVLYQINKTPVTMDDYLKNGVDAFRFGQHWESFRSMPNDKMLIKYEALEKPETLQAIEDFTGLKRESAIELKERNESVIDLEAVSKIHGRWQGFYESLPDDVLYGFSRPYLHKTDTEGVWW